MKSTSSKINKLKLLFKSISDIRDDYFDGLELTRLERKALKAFDVYRLKTLTEAKDTNLFTIKCRELRRIEHTKDYREFI